VRCRAAAQPCSRDARRRASSAGCHAPQPCPCPPPPPACSLTKLKLEHLQHVSPLGLRKLSQLTGLQRLLLSRCRLDDGVLAALAPLAALRTLALTSPLLGPAVGQQHFSSLGRLRALQQLCLHRLEPLPEAVLLRALPQLTALQQLELQQQEGATDAVLCALTALTGLTALSARFCRNVTSRSRRAVLEVRGPPRRCAPRPAGGTRKPARPCVRLCLPAAQQRRHQHQRTLPACRSAAPQAFGACIALDCEGCRVPDPLRPLQQPSNSTQACWQESRPQARVQPKPSKSVGSR
jgi:hypothetical protein